MEYNMKKLLCTVIAFIICICGCSCDNSTATDTSIDDSQNNTVVNATESVTNDGGVEQTTNSLLPEGIAYQFEDGTYITIESLLSPMLALNAICQGTSSSLQFDKIYPTDVLTKLVEYNHFKSSNDYADFLFTAYVQLYGDTFSLTNKFLSCTPLDYDELKDMTEFYNEYFFVDIIPDFAFIVESEFNITYTDEEGNEQNDSSSDYYIAYCLNGVIYLDYFYVDSLDL